MNKLEITGVIHHHPHYVILDKERIIRFTIKHNHSKELWSDFTYFACVWKNPPVEFWHHQQLIKGQLVFVEGEVSQQRFEREGSLGHAIKIKIKDLSFPHTDLKKNKNTEVRRISPFRK